MLQLLLQTRRVHATIRHQENAAASCTCRGHSEEKGCIESLEIGGSDGRRNDERLCKTDDSVADAGDGKQAGAEL